MPDPKQDSKNSQKFWEFSISGDEAAKIQQWQKKHDQKCPYYKKSGAIGGRFEFCFAPTSLGCVVKIKCACGEEFDATNYLDW